MRRKRSDGIPPSLLFIAQWEQRIAKQKQVIEELGSKGRSTAETQAALEQQQETLAKLRNHAEIMKELTKL